MPYFSRARFKDGGAGIAGHRIRYPTPGDDTPSEPVLERFPGQPVFERTDFCLDSGNSHYSADGVELWHDLYIDHFEYKNIPVLNGSSLLEGGINPEQIDFFDWPIMDLIGVVNEDLKSHFREHQVLITEEINPYDLRPYATDADIGAHQDLSTLLSPTTTLLVNAFPLTKKVDIPSFLIETLKDLPALVLFQGRTIIETGSNIWLGFQFGWKPLIQDMKDIFSLGIALQKRINTLRMLMLGGITSKGSLERHTEKDSFEFTFFVQNQAFTGTVERTTTMKRWGCIRYTVPPDIIDWLTRMTQNEQWWFSLQTLTGLHSKNLAAIWEILPWSWLIDWFAGIQQKLELYRPGMELIPKQYAIMTETVTEYSFSNVSSPFYHELDLKAMAFSCVRTTRERVVSNDTGILPSIPDAYPFLDDHRVGILSALAGQFSARLRKRKFDKLSFLAKLGLTF